MTNLSILNPFRPPDARFLRAHERLTQSSMLSRRHDDKKTAVILHFMRDRQRCQNATHHLMLWHRNHSLVLAFHLREQAQPNTRAILEARLLAAESISTIARKLGLPPSAVQWYAWTFFDIAGRLDARDFILHQVIQVPNEPDGAFPMHRLWKEVAFQGGSEALDQILGESLTGPMKGFGASSRGRGLNNYTRALLQQKMAVAVHSLDPQNNDKTATELLKVFGTLESKRKSEETVSARELQIEEHAAQMFEEIQTAFKTDWEKAPGDLRDFDSCATELRDDEIWQVGTGHKLPDAEELKKLQIPEPKKVPSPNAFEGI